MKTMSSNSQAEELRPPGTVSGAADAVWRLCELLEDWGEHGPSCPLYRPWDAVPGDECDCGLAAAMEGAYRLRREWTGE
jgi:hypothetical protein